MEPTTDYERFGRVPNVVFSCGSILIDDKLLIYYGGAELWEAAIDLEDVEAEVE